MKTRIASLAVLAALAILPSAVETRGRQVAGRWQDEFAARAKKHIEAICDIGPRPVGSPNEGRAAAYVADQFLIYGIIPSIEPVPFETYEPEEIKLRVGDKVFTPAGLGFDPYFNEGSTSYSGEFIPLDPSAPSNWPQPAAVAGKAVVTSEESFAGLHFRIAAMMPKCIVYVKNQDFSLIRVSGNRKLSLSWQGRFVEGMSRNVVARLGSNPPAPQIIIGAHMDAYRSAPGANDNASGVAAILEIARYAKGFEIPEGIGLTFVAFGGEEVGDLGSRRFVERHARELRNCLLALILDNLGGDGPVSIERDGGRQDPPTDPGATRIPVAYQGRCWEGLRYPWRLIPSPALYTAFGTPYHPAWLVAAINGAAKTLNFDVQFTGMKGSDEMSFAQAGIATSCLGAPNDRQHTPEDRPETVDLEKVRQCVEAARGILQNVLNHRTPAASGAAPSRKLEDPMAHVRFLASDELGGRRAGSREGEIAADYVRECLREAGVAPFHDLPDYFQNVGLVGSLPSPYRAPNVVGCIHGTDAKFADEFVLLVAHYDHLGRKSENGVEVIYNGARDNAMGVAALLWTAKDLALDPPSRSILVLATTAEEEGMIGSRYFVEHPPVPLARIVSVLNNDGAGVTRPELWCIGGLESSSARPLAEAAGREFELRTQPYPENFRFLFDKGDSASFAAKGIPSLTVSPGFSEEDVQRIKKYIHTPADRVDPGFDENYLRRFCRAYASLARQIADAGAHLPEQYHRHGRA
jgi:Zn-dependent M28 family amino/carboxypeptidase